MCVYEQRFCKKPTDSNNVKILYFEQMSSYADERVDYDSDSADDNDMEIDSGNDSSSSTKLDTWGSQTLSGMSKC